MQLERAASYACWRVAPGSARYLPADSVRRSSVVGAAARSALNEHDDTVAGVKRHRFACMLSLTVNWTAAATGCDELHRAHQLTSSAARTPATTNSNISEVLLYSSGASLSASSSGKRQKRTRWLGT